MLEGWAGGARGFGGSRGDEVRERRSVSATATTELQDLLAHEFLDDV
jgi:hypothetical protein